MLPTLRAERDRLKGELASCDDAKSFITLHPATIAAYQAAIDRLADTMKVHTGAEDDRGALVRDFRALVHSVVVTPSGNGRELLVEVRGRLAALIGGDVFPDKVGERMVAEEGLEPPTRGL